ncbi:related to polypeptide chain release factors [Phialocephala subalpina]|uniref:Related to polypeptide chain release factors n=1 Tax=Phialocephala subalpina TaxID=576137 RepID=A0A1L7X4Q0_9HELO|nr:related to polypeptide chain release factors [Phialocephala subalpina]
MIRGLLSHASRRLAIQDAPAGLIARRGINASCSAWARKMPDRPQLVDEDEFTEAFLKGSGPGGQKINKTSSAVQLKHIPTGIVLKVQATRSRTQNRKIARQMLAERVEEIQKGKESRVAVVGETKKKRKSSAVKKSKRKYRLLEEAKAQKDAGYAAGEENGEQ